MIKKVIVILALILCSCKTHTINPEMENERNIIRKERAYIHDEWKPAGPRISSFYNSLIENSPTSAMYPIWHYSLGLELDSIVAIPQNSNNKTILFIHGYAGTLSGFGQLMVHQLNLGYTIVGLTLPGHSLSQGERGGIDNFNSYGKAVHEFLLQIQPYVPPIEYAIGHSTGCSSIIIYNQNYDSTLKKAVFISPLIRSSYYTPSKVVRFLTKPFINTTEVKWKEPFAIDYFPLSWFDRLVDWNKELPNYSTQDIPIFIFQGTKDDVVSWKYNLKRIPQIYTNSRSLIIKDANHVLFYDDEILTTINPIIDNFFSE